MSMSRMVSSFSSILSEAQAIQTSTLHTFSLFLKSFGTLTAQNASVTDLHIPKKHYYLTKDIRPEEMASLLQELVNPTHSCIACTGGYGIGKSALALLAIHEPSVAATFGHRRWINCHALTHSAHFLQVLAAQMGVPPAEFPSSACESRLETIVVTIQRLYPAGRILVVLDDLDHLYFLDKSFADTVIEALANIKGLTLLLTVNGWTPAPPLAVEWSLQLQALTPDRAALLFHSIYPVPFQRTELAELLELVGAVPQYIVILANMAYEQRLQPADLLQIIDDPEMNLLGAEMDGHKSLEASMHAYAPEDRLGRDPHALRVFHVLASLPGGIPRDRLKSYVGLPPETIDSICDQLSHLSFIQTEHPGHLMLTKPVRDYALRFSEFDDQTRQAFLSRVISLAEIPKSRLRPGAPNFSQTARQFENDRTNLENILFTFLDQNFPIAVEAALRYLTPLCAVRPSLKLTAKVVDVAEKDSDPRLLAQALRTLGEVQYNGGDLGAEGVLGRAEMLFSNWEDEDNVINGLECRFLLSEIRSRTGGMPEELEYPEGLEDAVQLSSTLSSEPGKRCHAHGVLKLASLTRDQSRARKLLETAQATFNDLGDNYGLAQCALRLGKLTLADAATKFQAFGDLDMAARCYSGVVSPHIEYIKINNFRETYLARGGGADKVLELLRKAIDIYELLGRHLDVAFCQYHLAQLLPPTAAVTLYSRAIHQFKTSHFTHHRERATLDMCYSLMEEENYSEAIPYLEVLQELIGYCGQIFVVRCRELLTECHCRLNATRPALQAVRGTLDAIQQLDSTYLDEIGLLTPKYINLLTALNEPSNTPPAIAYETHAEGQGRFIELAEDADSEEVEWL